MASWLVIELVLASMLKFFHLKSPVEHCLVHLEVKRDGTVKVFTSRCPDPSSNSYLPIETRTNHPDSTTPQ
jgi:hypothetical protein